MSKDKEDLTKEERGKANGPREQRLDDQELAEELAGKDIKRSGIDEDSFDLSDNEIAKELNVDQTNQDKLDIDPPGVDDENQIILPDQDEEVGEELGVDEQREEDYRVDFDAPDMNIDNLLGLDEEEEQ